MNDNKSRSTIYADFLSLIESDIATALQDPVSKNDLSHQALVRLSRAIGETIVEELKKGETPEEKNFFNAMFALAYLRDKAHEIVNKYSDKS